MGSLRFVPADGEWTVLAAWPTVVTISAGVPDAVVDEIWTALGATDASIESVVSSIPIRGAAADSSFTVVRFEPDGGVALDPAHPPLAWTATVVARGSAAVDLLSVGGSRRFGSAGMQPWALAEFPSVIGVSTGALPPVPESLLRLPTDARRLDHGIAHASRILWAASAETIVNERGMDRDGDTAESPTKGIDHDPDTADGDTVIGLRSRATVDTVAPVVEERTGDGAEAPFDLAADEPVPLYEIRVGDQPVLELTGAVVIGRRPQPRRSPDRLFTQAPAQALITVDSPDQEVSANHVEIALSGRTVVVTDLRSTNGTTVRIPGRPAMRLRQGDSVVASGSAIVEIGDGNVIHISSRDRGNTGITV
ncbi:FHA domain-containing protein [Herbiconiux sp. CPCC 205763]|uniref:FHA domain-containing protein n=1 Tax=Herbiconiux aconitum TaxID=2970913 RepID=A0ABT2GX65_9MICO|nr:FHA domain-containing protein [Herbiconiux aconitum]MCS5719895.1 FHA domain-containing protein [Herbiconiux aconitum]